MVSSETQVLSQPAVGPSSEQAASESAPADPAHAASAPLRLDAATIRAASARSKGAVRQLAEASDRPLDEAEHSAQERRIDAMKSAAIPRCWDSKANGSLLSLPLMAAAALTGKCH
jgi:hypothetical protein